MTPLDDHLDRTDALVAARADAAGPLLRWGLGATVLLAGVHKFVAPAAWHAYLAPALASLWPTALVSLDILMVLFGVSEVAFAALLFADCHTPTVAAATALSLVATVGNLALAAAQGQPVVDVLVRDLGLALFAAGVALDAGRPD